MVLGSRRGRLAVLAAAQVKGEGVSKGNNKKSSSAAATGRKNPQVFGSLKFSPREGKGPSVNSHKSEGHKKASPAPPARKSRKESDGKQLAAPQLAPPTLERGTSFGRIVRREDSFAPQTEEQERIYTPTKKRHLSPLSHFKVAKRSRLSPSKASLHRQRELVLSPSKQHKAQEMLLHTPVKANRRTTEEDGTRIPVPLMPRTPEIHTPNRNRDRDRDRDRDRERGRERDIYSGAFRTISSPRVREYATSTCTPPPAQHASVREESNRSKLVGRGLVNLGNTCYLNAVTSVLLHLTGFCREVMAVNGQGFLTTQSVCVALQNLLRKKEQEGIGLNPMALKECIARFASQFQGNFEQDAHEFYCILLEMIEKEYLQIKLAMKCKQEADKRALNFTESLQETGCPSSRTFMGSVEHVFTCSVCKNQSSVIETFKDISLTLDESDGGKMSHSLQSLVKQHFATEVISKDCEKCRSHSVPHTLVYKLRRLPSIFVVHLKRLTTVQKPNGDLALEKSACGVDVTPTLDLRQFCDQRTCMPVQCNAEGSSNLETPVKGREENQREDSAAGFEALDLWKNSTTPPKFLDLCHDNGYNENSPADGRSGDLQEKRWVETAIEESLRDSSSAKAKDHKTPQKQITLISTETTNLAPNTPEEFPASCLSSLKVVDNLDCQTFASMASSNIEYSLSAVISHLGGPTSGHYISHLKRENTGQWLCYNDEVVTTSDWRDLQNQSRNCYMLFYSHKVQAA